MGKRNYLNYLRTPEWNEIRTAARRRARWKCERESPLGPRHEGPLEVHHRHYRTLGYESLDDVEVLCRRCHHNRNVPKNQRKRLLERFGQTRLFDRWGHDEADEDQAA